jgi:hypothetical protein
VAIVAQQARLQLQLLDAIKRSGVNLHIGVDDCSIRSQRNSEVIASVMQMTESRNEFYKGWYAIEVFARSLEDGTFETHGFIRHTIVNPKLLNDLPMVDPFDTQGANYSTADQALNAGMGFAKKKIDDLK